MQKQIDDITNENEKHKIFNNEQKDETNKLKEEVNSLKKKSINLFKLMKNKKIKLY